MSRFERYFRPYKKEDNFIDGSELRQEIDEITKKLVGSAMSSMDIEYMDNDDIELMQAAARLNRHAIEYMEKYEDIINDNIKKLDRIEEMVSEMYDKQLKIAEN